MRISGTWDGAYTYGPDYAGLTGTSVPFRMSITESWLGRVVGYVRDDAARGGQRERGRIAGRRKRAELRFVKTMPKKQVLVDGLLRDFAEVLAEDGFRVERFTEPHRIHYAGELAADGRSVQGFWVIEPMLVETDRGLIETGGGRGSWRARLVSGDPSAV